ncbi:MAG: hypothetical protein LBC84_10385 [Prevotellaceae bacterium]|jgi:hypothetical protein|nr:hypothetical protein [Prevotellaceae bacterium]
MKRLLTLFTSLILFFYANGQDRIVSAISSGDDLNEVFASSRYLFPEFQDARIIMTTGSYLAKMNYNALSGEMEFIKEDSGELMMLGNKSDVRAIIIGNRHFKYAPRGYVEVLANGSGDVELVVNRIFVQGDRKKYGAFGTTSSTTSISSFSQISTDNGVQSLSVKEEVTYVKKNFFYLFTSGKYILASKSTFKKVFGKQKPDIDVYLKNNPVNFSKELDVVRLFTYCSDF